MPLTQTREQIRDNVRRLANIQGASALLRHPDADLNDYVNRGLSRLRFLLTQASPDQRYLSTVTANTSSGTSTYALPSDFGFLISVDVVADGTKHWLGAYEMAGERAALTSPDVPSNGIPFTYRLRAGNVELLPTPGGAYAYTLWYVPHTTELASDAAVLDTINRLDEYVVAHATRLVAIKDKNWDLKNAAAEMMVELQGEIEVLGRSRDMNSPPRIVDVYQASRWGPGRRRR